MKPAKPFQKGNKFGKGGPRPGSGRPMNWMKELAADLLKKNKLLEYVAQVGAGEKTEKKVAVNPFTGQVTGEYEVVPKTENRLKAVEFLAKTADDKLGDLSGQTQTPVVIMLPSQGEGEGGKVS